MASGLLDEALHSNPKCGFLPTLLLSSRGLYKAGKPPKLLEANGLERAKISRKEIWLL